MLASSEDDIANEGNFREALRFRLLAGDTELKEHLETAPANATYISPRIQNEIVSSCGSLLVRQIVESVGARCFSVLADETTDVCGIKQLSVSLRYVNLVEKKWCICEDFIGFTEIADASGKD